MSVKYICQKCGAKMSMATDAESVRCPLCRVEMIEQGETSSTQLKQAAQQSSAPYPSIKVAKPVPSNTPISIDRLKIKGGQAKNTSTTQKKEAERILEDAQKKAERILEKAKTQGEELASGIIEQAEAEANDMLEIRRAEVDKEIAPIFGVSAEAVWKHPEERRHHGPKRCVCKYGVVGVARHMRHIFTLCKSHDGTKISPQCSQCSSHTC